MIKDLELAIPYTVKRNKKNFCYVKHPNTLVAKDGLSGDTKVQGNLHSKENAITESSQYTTVNCSSTFHQS